MTGKLKTYVMERNGDAVAILKDFSFGPFSDDSSVAYKEVSKSEAERILDEEIIGHNIRDSIDLFQYNTTRKS